VTSGHTFTRRPRWSSGHGTPKIRCAAQAALRQHVLLRPGLATRTAWRSARMTELIPTKKQIACRLLARCAHHVNIERIVGN
jgi:hypothetical protein